MRTKASTIKEIQLDIDFSIKNGDELDSKSWGYEQGILLTVNDAKLLIGNIKDSEEMACSFAEWCLDRNIEFYDNTEKGNIYLYNGEEKTTKELYQIYLEHLNK